MPEVPRPDLDPTIGLLDALRSAPLSERLGAVIAAGEGLRERKKRLTRQLISDTATAMFLDRGFDAVPVSEVARACGVSEKTVYNYFPSKESLLLDREEAMAAAIRRALGPGAPGGSPIEAAIGVISDDLKVFAEQWLAEPERPFDLSVIQRFTEMVERTPSLRAARQDMMDRLAQVAARAMAARAAVDPDDPEPQIASNAILGLWRVQFRAMHKYADGSRSVAEMCDAVLAEVRRAARLIDTGLWSFGVAVQGPSGREQLRLAAEAANEARKQVIVAIRQAREAWRQVVAEGQSRDELLEARGRGRADGRDRRGRSRAAKR